VKKILGLTIAALLVILIIGGGTWAFFQDSEFAPSNGIVAGTLDLALGRSTTTNFSVGPSQAYPGANVTSDYYYTLSNSGTVTGELSISLSNVVNAESTGFTQHENDTTGTPNVSGNATGGTISTVVDTGASFGSLSGTIIAVEGKGSGVIASNTADTITLVSGQTFTSAVTAGDAYTIGTGTGELGGKVELRLWLDMNENSIFDDGADYGLYLYNGNETVYQSSGYYSSADVWITIDALDSKTWDTSLPQFAENDDCRFYIDWRIPFGSVPDNSFQGDSVAFDLEYTLTQVP
jgi:predicted ribosomally synthesized peptide with SipW-like signal peptide